MITSGKMEGDMGVYGIVVFSSNTSQYNCSTNHSKLNRLIRVS